MIKKILTTVLLVLSVNVGAQDRPDATLSLKNQAKIYFYVQCIDNKKFLVTVTYKAGGYAINTTTEQVFTHTTSETEGSTLIPEYC